MSADFLTKTQGVGAMGDAANAVGAMTSGLTEMRNSNAQGKADLFNAGVARQNMTATAQQGALRTQQIALENGQQQGRLRASQAQSNTGEGGTNALIQRQGETNAELNQMVSDYDTQMRRATFANASGMDVYQAKIAKGNSLNFLATGATSATSRMLNGYRRYINNGVPMPMNTSY